ncbi:oligoendopeptidase F [Pseudoflavonifractor hominis]|uniref:Oligopeptidase F n=1 Tax=Pseudoflavonifractor hominis TaxID=2763059 RepID=A0ABR7HPG6_9FIRM|nr:oligoendopeptidase F [Pseudoflavonifractor hominis]MBC5729411.1 oligoendopeptidase F [Pseudoflavonifractor hominis]
MPDHKTIPLRSEIPEAYTWNTADLYPTDDAWHTDAQLLRTQIDTLGSYAGRLGSGADTLYDYVTLEQEAGERLSKLLDYAQRKSDEDTRVDTYQAMVGKAMSLYVDFLRATAFETPEVLSIPEEQLEAFYAQKPELTLYRRYFHNIQRRRSHTLSDAEERLLAAAGDMAQAPDDIFSKLTDADLTFPPAVDSQGVQHPLSNASYTLLMASEDRALRKSAFEGLYASYGGMKNTLAATLSSQVKQLQFFATARKYPSALSASLDANHVPESVYHTLIRTVRANLDKMHRYVRLRRKLLGVDELHMYDVYAPMVSGGVTAFPYDQAKETVYQAMAPLGEEYQSILREALDHRWIDVYENVGKRSGGYMSGAMVHPYILLNYQDDLDSMFTLAHELGHAVHSYRSNRDQPTVYRDYVIFVAEVASTCNETLLMEHLLARTSDKRSRAFLINHFLEQFKSTLYRQTMFAEFELRMGELAAQGETLTADLLCREYKALNEAYFGPDMVSDDAIALEWSRIPHFYYNYYAFQYATGYSAAIALSRRILSGGPQAVEDYLHFLSGGCSQDPIDLLKGAGVDMTSPQPIQSALDLFDQLLDEMESLMEA